MSSPIAKGMRRSTSRQSAAKSSAKSRAFKTKAARPKPMAKRSTTAKAPAKKARRVAASSVSKAKSAKKVVARPKKVAPVKSKTPKKTISRKVAKTVRPKKVVTARATVKKAPVPVRAVRAQRPVAPPTPPRQPTADEANALQAFERAHKEFTRGRFQEARSQFRVLLDKYSQVSEVAARVRTYLAVSEARLRTESMLPRDADSLYDRGVIELNRGEFVAAQEMFERALKREPEAAHIHYGLAATRARLGAIDLALQSLQRALDLQPNLRVRAQHDQDLTPLRNDPDFDKLIFAPRL